MKSILSASACAAVLTFAVPALAATSTTATPSMHHHAAKHHMGRKGSKTAQSGDAAVQDLNSKSLAAARSGQPLDVGGSGSSSGASTPTSPSTGAAPSTGSAPVVGGPSAPGG